MTTFTGCGTALGRRDAVHDRGRVGRLQDLARKRQHPPDGPIDLAAALRDAVALAHAGLEHETAISEKHYPLEVAIPELPPVLGSFAVVNDAP